MKAAGNGKSVEMRVFLTKEDFESGDKERSVHLETSQNPDRLWTLSLKKVEGYAVVWYIDGKLMQNFDDAWFAIGCGYHLSVGYPMDAMGNVVVGAW